MVVMNYGKINRFNGLGAARCVWSSSCEEFQGETVIIFDIPMPSMTNKQYCKPVCPLEETACTFKHDLQSNPGDEWPLFYLNDCFGFKEHGHERPVLTFAGDRSGHLCRGPSYV